MRRITGGIAVAAALTGTLATASPAGAQVREARFWVTVHGAQSIEWTEAVHETGSSCFARTSRGGSGTDAIELRTTRRFKLLALSYNPATVTLEENTWNRERLETPPIVASATLEREGAIQITQQPGACGGTTSSRDTGPYDCGRRRGTFDVRLLLEPGGRLLMEPQGGLDEAPDPFSECPLVEPDGMAPNGWTRLVGGRLTARQLFGSKRRIVIRAREDFDDRPDEHTRTSGTVRWTVTLTRVR